ncbi:hypothetical protein COO60DRAFT_451666 [Scenedesmus sp. NREL 46B-D3]|nr:hypothetical protein COO60DRAFT_451666 [Scenedesmus sp. NREL 46B-D3]
MVAPLLSSTLLLGQAGDASAAGLQPGGASTAQKASRRVSVQLPSQTRMTAIGSAGQCLACLSVLASHWCSTRRATAKLITATATAAMPAQTCMQTAAQPHITNAATFVLLTHQRRRAQLQCSACGV